VVPLLRPGHTFVEKLEGRKVWTIALAEEEGLLVERHNLEVILAVEYTQWRLGISYPVRP
jgi:hypothetical protein